MPIRLWSRFPSLYSSPEAQPKLQTLPSKPSEPSSEAPQLRNTSSQDNNASATKSLRPTITPDQSSTQSQKLKLNTPLIFPPSNLKVNPMIETKIQVEEVPLPKSVMVNKTVEKPNANVNGSGSLMKETGVTQKRGMGNHEKQVTTKENEIIDIKLSGSKDPGIRVITIAGENKGACMRKMQSPKKLNYKNSNVQCVNNSMLFNTSCTHHDPGRHFTLSCKQ